jgi:FAD/FMN-containing dehydrogenase
MTTGHSALATTLGLGVDNILQIKAVFPDGQYLTANRCKNQDLFFALRGGGGNAFGIVMEVAMRAHPHFRTQVYISRWSSGVKSADSVTFKALSGSVSATSAPQLRRILEVIAAHSNEWAAKGWGGTIGVGLQGAHHVRFVLENIRLDNMAARRSMRALSEIAPTLTIAEHNTYYSCKAQNNFGSIFISF